MKTSQDEIVERYLRGLREYKNEVARYHLWMKSLGLDLKEKEIKSWPTGSAYNDHLRRTALLKGMETALCLTEEEVQRIQSEAEADANRIHH